MKRKTHRKLHKSTNIMMRLASVLFVLVLASTCMLAGMLARYTVSSAGTDTARVAGFSVSVVNATDRSSTTMDLGVTTPLAVYALDIGNQSEVAVNYDIVLELSKKLPEGISVYIADNVDGSSMIDVSATEKSTLFGQRYEFANAGQMQANSETMKYLVFAPDTTNIIYDNLGTATEYKEEIDFTVDVIFVQVD